jgi:hypothetical protein
MDEKGAETVFRELLAARKRERLARETEEEAWQTAGAVGEEAGGYEAHTEARRDGGTEGGRAHAEARRAEGTWERGRV